MSGEERIKTVRVEPVKVEARGMLFDMDGVLMSSLGSVERSWAKWGVMRGVDAATAIKTAHGQRAIDTIRILRPDLNDVEELAVIEQIEIDDVEGMTVFPGVIDLLRSLPRDKWTIVTSATKRLAQSRLEHAGIPLPDRFITADMVVHGKPDPEPYLRGAELLGLAADECVVIEDAPAGVRAGKAAGCRVIAVLNSHAQQDLAAADWHVASLERLKVAVAGDGALGFEFEAVALQV